MKAEEPGRGGRRLPFIEDYMLNLGRDFTYTVLHPTTHSANPDQGMTCLALFKTLACRKKKQETQVACSHKADVLVRNYSHFTDEKLKLR